MSAAHTLASSLKNRTYKRLLWILLGLGLFLVVYLSPPWAEAVDPLGQHFPLTREGKASLGLFLLAGIWLVFEVVPIGITAITIGVIQVLFFIRKPEAAFSHFLDPSVWFIFASLILGKAFTKSGLTQRLVYNLLALVGERTSRIYLGCSAMIAILTLVMAHTAVAATVFPLLMAVYSLYQDNGLPTRFGKGLFLGMAYAAGASSVVTLLGAARGVVALGFFKEIAGREISFMEFSYYLLPLGWTMVIILWLLLWFSFKPERKTIPGLKERARDLASKLGPLKRTEWFTLLIMFAALVLLGVQSFVPAIAALDKAAILLGTTILFFLLKILTIQDLEELPWNIVLLFGGALCLGFCLWQTGATQWLAVQGLVLFQETHGLVFVLSLGLTMLALTNVLINVAVLALALPVALVMASYLGVAPEVVLFTSLATAGMPFVLLLGAAPNAIAYESKQFSAVEFLKIGLPASGLLMIVLGLFVRFIWPWMGLPVTGK